jgi:hypothetical protein
VNVDDITPYDSTAAESRGTAWTTYLTNPRSRSNLFCKIDLHAEFHSFLFRIRPSVDELDFGPTWQHWIIWSSGLLMQTEFELSVKYIWIQQNFSVNSCCNGNNDFIYLRPPSGMWEWITSNDEFPWASHQNLYPLIKVSFKISPFYSVNVLRKGNLLPQTLWHPQWTDQNTLHDLTRTFVCAPVSTLKWTDGVCSSDDVSTF